ncbi:MAG TPA: kinase [Caulobacteraceae bacterium]|jgi:D-glycerate 3-kinase|nr:kinase [Caulobacteraceae bacterium]
MVAVGGCQASGKSTLVRMVAKDIGAARFSLDDVYRTRAERQAMARDIHPLFITRGPPGTHDLDLADGAIDALTTARDGAGTRIPSFDKLADDRLPPRDWPVFEGKPSAILVEGWCMNATPQADAELVEPANALEAEEDPDATWRRRVNAELAGRYQTFFNRFSRSLYLAAPSFDVVLDWRCEQEAGLLGVPAADLPPERRANLTRFIAHYERLTRHMIAGDVDVNLVARLGPERTLLALEEK